MGTFVELSCTCTLSVRLHYTVATLCCAGHDSVALALRFCGACGSPWRFCYDPTTTMKVRLRLDDDEVTTLLQPRRSLQFCIMSIHLSKVISGQFSFFLTKR